MVLLVKGLFDSGDVWKQAFSLADPGLEVRVWPEAGDLADVEHALVWAPPRGLLKRCSNLKIIFSEGAGVDHILASDPEIPRHVPVVRMVEPGLAAGMVEYVVMSVLHHHRFMLDYTAQRASQIWREIRAKRAQDRCVGIMGLGVLGSAAAAKLVGFGFKVSGWGRDDKASEDLAYFRGDGELDAFLAQTDILVCLLPLTAETKGILNARTFGKLPAGASVINVARGGHLVEEDLLSALDSGHLAGATLDVFNEEPLPGDHPFWTHPRIVMTPHVASMIVAESASEAIIDNIRRLSSGQPLLNVADLELGY